MFNEPRAWKWMVPALCAAALGVLAIWSQDKSEVLSGLGWAWCGIFVLAALLNGRVYYGQHFTSQYVERRQADSVTPLTLVAKSMELMHPSAVEFLKMNFGRMMWEVLAGATPDVQVEWVLRGTQVTYPFMFDFLDLSSKTSCIAEWKLASEGARRYAPKGFEKTWCTDREQYQQFIAHLHALHRITKAHGNQPPQWIPPWTPELVAKTLGIDLEGDVEEPKREETVEQKRS